MASVCQRTEGKYSLSSYGSIGSVKRPVRLPAAGRDPHAGCCGGWGVKTPGYPIRPMLPQEFLLPRGPFLFQRFSPRFFEQTVSE